MIARNTADTYQVRRGICGRRLHLAQTKQFGGDRRGHAGRPNAREDRSWRGTSPSGRVRESERRAPRSQGALPFLIDPLVSRGSPAPRKARGRDRARERSFRAPTPMAPAASTQSRARTSHRSGFAEIVCYLCNLSSDGHRGIAFGFVFVLFFCRACAVRPALQHNTL